VNWFKKVGFYQVYEYPICIKSQYWLSHEPLYLCDSGNYVNIHGHTHDARRFVEFEHVLTDSHHINVCVEYINFTPVSLEKLISTPKQVSGEKLETFNNL
jgi:calcineurin-like phosphoesterase family protein